MKSLRKVAMKWEKYLTLVDGKPKAKTLVHDDLPDFDDEVYGAGWNGSLEAPTKNAVYDKIESLSGGSGAFTADGDTLITATTPVVLDQATGDEAALTLNYTTNKATSGDDTGLLINQTDTASPGTSLLADFQVGGTSKLSINNSGKIGSPNNIVFEPNGSFC